MSDLWLGKSSTPLTLPSSKLVTHMVCLGTTGSGKTGLCIALLEELGKAGIPVIAIDPKGDLTNLALTEPPEEKKAAWEQGQAGWGISPEQVQQWKNSVDVRIYTPGSDAGIAVDVLAALRRPQSLEDPELTRDRAIGTVSALLGLVNEEADPVRSPAHVVLTRILEEAWSKDQDPDLEALLALLMDPPFQKIGVFPTDRFFPPDDRFELARKLNTILASPAFAAWGQGVALEPERMLAPSSRTPIHIFTLSHLSDSERQFFVGLLLDRVALWTRSLPGTDQLRAIIFFDEIWGFLPPYPKDPPSKKPLLTLLKQARAVGVGAVLATQNPVDLDYKALSNAGTWLVGRLQTRNDRDRVAEGFSSAGLDREAVDKLLDQTAPRRFVLAQSGKAPVLFDTRWTRVYLAGPLTRTQLKALNNQQSPPSRPPPASPPPQAAPGRTKTASRPPKKQWLLNPATAFSARLNQAFTPEPGREAAQPALLVEVQLNFRDAAAGFNEQRREYRVFYPLEDELPLAPLILPLEETDLLPLPQNQLVEPLPHWLDEEEELLALSRRVCEEIHSMESSGVWINPVLKLNSKAGESEAVFKERVTAKIEGQIETAIAGLYKELKKQIDSLESRLKSLTAQKEKLERDHSSQQTRELLNAGETMLAWFTGRSRSFNRLTRIVDHREKVGEAARKVEEVEAELVTIRAQLYELESELERKVAAIRAELEAAADQSVHREILLEPGDVRCLRSGVLWIPAHNRKL